MPDPGPSSSDRAAPAIEGGFVHLHLHSEYSLLDGGNRVDKLVKRVKELGMNAVAVTDHGNLFGAATFYLTCKDHGVLPILGVEAYVTPPGRSRTDRTFTGVSDGGYHLVLLAENDTGWNNLLYLCSEAYLSGFYFKPRIDRELLAKHSEGLIAINGHLGSEIGDHLLAFERTGDRKHWDKAEESALWHAKTFNRSDEVTKLGSDGAKGEESATSSLRHSVTPSLPGFYIELQHHVDEQNSINKHLIKLATDLRLPLVCDNDSHFLKAEDHDAHDTLICISMGKVKSDPDRMRYPTELYVKSPTEMRELFEREYGEHGKAALDNTVRIAERCAGKVKLPLGASNAPMVRVKLPAKKDLPTPADPRFGGDLTAWYNAYCSTFEVVPFAIPAGADDAEKRRLNEEAKKECDAALRMLAEAGFIWRYGLGGPAQSGPALRAGSSSSSSSSELGVSDTASGSESRTTRVDEKTARLERELKILADKNITAYFLIVWDFVSWGRQRGIPSNARGSGVGTMVGYVLGLSNACPVQYGLLFERFTDPDRSEFPDIDIDLCQNGRAEVISYVRQKYGHVAQIITFGTLKARAAVRDVARVMEISLPEADKLAKLIPEQLGMTLDQALIDEPELKKLYDSDPRITRLIDNARTMEGQARHASVHAAGVIVATRPLHEIVPLYKQSSAADHEIVTQWDGPTREKFGLLKMDFLGLRTLSVIERARKLIRETLDEREIWNAVGRVDEYEKSAGSRKSDVGTKKAARSSHPASDIAHPTFAHPLDLDRLTFDDPRVFSLFQRADTTGVFQFESGGMRRLLIEMKPDRLEDLIAANALFRPGPMDLIPDYNRRKHGTEQVPKVHEVVDKYTAETYGVMVYQEQVMQIVHGLGGGGGITLRDAYSLIKNISKKKHDKIDKERPKFVDGAQRQGLSRQAADELFEMILKFAGYGFNKSHSTGYAIVAYQTAYLKTYYPNQYMAAFLTFESGAQKVSDWIQYVEDCKKVRFVNGKVGVEVRPPDVNLSLADFSVVYLPGEERIAVNGHVRFGVGAIKGVGEKAIDAIVLERDGAIDAALRVEPKPFVSIHDFCERVLSKSPAAGNGGSGGSGGAILNKGTVEALVKCGAMDALHGRENRAAMIATIEPAMSAAQKVAADKAAGQGGLFLGPTPGAGGAPTLIKKADAPQTGSLVKTTPWTEAETLASEKEALGFYVSSHPLTRWKQWASVFATATSDTARSGKQDQRVVLPGLVQGIRAIIVKNGRSAGQKMGIVSVEDELGTVECVLFADCFSQFSHLLTQDAVVFMLGRVDRSRAGMVTNRKQGGAAGAGADDEDAGAAAAGGASGNENVQIVVDRVVPIDGVPLMPGRMWLRVDCEKLNGSGEQTINDIAAIVKASGSAPKPGHAPADKAQQFPIEIVLDTAEARVRLEVPSTVRVIPTPALVAELSGKLGDGTIRVVGGVAVELPGSRPRWNGQKKAG